MNVKEALDKIGSLKVRVTMLSDLAENLSPEKYPEEEIEAVASILVDKINELNAKIEELENKELGNG